MTLNHGFSGYVCGRVAMPVLRRHAPISEAAMGWAFFIGAMMPDGDVLTRVLGGRGNYFSGGWYGHRQFSHSLLGTLVYALIIAAVVFAPVVWRHESKWRAYGWTVGCLWVGGWLHLLGDMMTPGRPLPIFWPLPETFGSFFSASSVALRMARELPPARSIRPPASPSLSSSRTLSICSDENC